MGNETMAKASEIRDKDLRQQVTSLVERWQGFQTKVSERVASILVEGRAGLAQIIEEHALDSGPMGTALTAVQTRFQGVDRKVDEAWEQLDESFDELTDDEELDEATYDVIWTVEQDLRREVDALRATIETTGRSLEVSSRADWARNLAIVAEQERSQPLTCSQCGAPIERSVFWQSSNVTCGHCGSVNGVEPGAASSTFYQGGGVEALCQERAWPARQVELAAEEAYKHLRHPTASDWAQWMAAARAYWTKYYETMGELHPGHGQPVAEAVANRLAGYGAYEPPVEKVHRDFFESLCRASAAGDGSAVRALLGQLPVGVDLDECAECLMEHGDGNGARTTFMVQYRVEQETDDQQEWLAEQMRSLRETLSD
ncbi:MAG: hypothetical protein J7M25_15200 [Deltaproteobacteria bacterium]|nr:hypothetical protein [Deltaproteobacteria bacterium]